MTLSSSNTKRSGGQSLVEFALVMPVVLFLALMAADFGRIYFTSIQLSNAVREAAKYGANDPSDPSGMLARANAERNSQSQAGQLDGLTYPTNMSMSCATPGGSPIACADAKGGSGIGNTLTVTLNVPFTFMTPLIGNVFGGSLTISSSATVAVLGLAADPNAGDPDGCGAPETPVLTVTTNGLTAVLDPAGSLPDSGVCAISGYNYDFGDGQSGVGGTVPTNHTYLAPGTYTIRLTVTNQGGTATTTTDVTVPAPTPTPTATPTPTGSPTPTPSGGPTPTPTPTPTASPTATPTPTATPCPAPDAAYDYDTSSHGSKGHADFFDESTYTTGCPITVWLWDFGDGTPLSNAQNPSHDFANKNSFYTVTLTVTNAGGSDSVSHTFKPK